MTYRLLPHTADVKAAVDAPDLLALHQAAVDLVRELLVGAAAVADDRQVVIPPEGDEPGERLFRFVRELLYLYDVEGFLPQRVVALDPPTVAGETFDAARHAVEHGVKALTRHQYVFVPTADGYHVEMVFDL